ncbi:MAG: hypothetical protein ACXVEE_30695 [Polyangiales bacterium]
MTSYAVDPDRSTVTIRTRAKGLLSALAHDLELTAKVARGTAKRDGDQWEGEIVVEAAAIKVVGAIKGGKTSPLSKIEVDMCEKRIVSEVFAGVHEIVVKARGTVADPKIDVTAKRTAPAKLKLTLEGDVIHGRGTVSIQALGLPEVKAPLNAFTVRDDVDLEASLQLR